MIGPIIPIIDWNNNGVIDGDDITMSLAIDEEEQKRRKSEETEEDD